MSFSAAGEQLTHNKGKHSFSGVQEKLPNQPVKLDPGKLFARRSHSMWEVLTAGPPNTGFREGSRAQGSERKHSPSVPESLKRVFLSPKLERLLDWRLPHEGGSIRLRWLDFGIEGALHCLC